MMPNRVIAWIVALVAMFGSLPFGENPNGYVFAGDQPPPVPDQEQPEVLTRGPVHEAFAEPVNLQSQAGFVVPNQPPADIEEIPPTDRPQDDQFVWIPGYWSWDEDRNDFIWVSGCWRAAPTNLYWAPGYWTQGNDGWEWVAGFWAPADTGEIEYLPMPPEPVDLEPLGPPPTADIMWVPACWYWDHDQYIQRPGYWLQQQQGWMWVPSHYRWTPRGYVFNQGHWDYSLDRRGVLFAPVYFPRSVYARSDYSYSPSIAIDMGILTANLFTYPRYSHYYFGDYYDDAYLHRGIYPRFESERIHTWYDPIYTYDRWHYGRNDNRWEEHQREEYDHRRANKDLRPSRTYREQETRLDKLPEPQRRNIELGKPLQTIVERKASPLKFEPINTDARQKITRQATDVRKFRQERVKWETAGSTNPETVTPPVETKTIPPAQHNIPVTPTAVYKDQETPRAENMPVRVPPRRVLLTKPERVKIPAPPIVGKPNKTSPAEKGPPPRPVDEQKHKTKIKDTNKDEGRQKKN